MSKKIDMMGKKASKEFGTLWAKKIFLVHGSTICIQAYSVTSFLPEGVWNTYSLGFPSATGK